MLLSTKHALNFSMRRYPRPLWVDSGLFSPIDLREAWHHRNRDTSARNQLAWLDELFDRRVVPSFGDVIGFAVVLDMRRARDLPTA